MSIAASIVTGALYVVATPIGNLADLSQRAIEVLKAVDQIAAEDTRHSRHLLQHYQIQTPCIAYHEHNERTMCRSLIARVLSGHTLALISDAGTPLISDPGFHLIREAHHADVQVIPIPGASALVCALSASGLPTDRFVFEGFLPARTVARVRHLESLRSESRTLIFYESSHRIMASLEDIQQVFGGQRQLCLARELTKRFETIRTGPVSELFSWLQSDGNQQRGEFVLCVHGAQVDSNQDERKARDILQLLAQELPGKQAVMLTAKMTGIRRNRLYAMLIEERGHDA